MNKTRREFLAATAAAPLAAAALAGANHEKTSAAILAKPRIGAEFFLNTTETRASVFTNFARMADTGLTIARIFTLWDQIEHKQGVWDFTHYDWIYDAAAQHGILIANTLCSEDPPGWMGTAPFYHAWRDLSNPQLRPYSEIYLDKVINHYKTHAAHGVWLLENEPGIRNHDEPYVLAAYARWLEHKYGTVANLNRVWYLQLKNFNEARLPQNSKTAGWADYASNLDWLRFRCDHLVDQLNWLHTQVDKHDPGALTHVNPPGLTANMPAGGGDMWKIKRTVAYLGASMHASWSFGMFPRSDFGVAFAYCCDLTRSASAPAPWWVTEMQAGPTVFTGSRPLNPTGEEITRWLWDGLGNGARGMVFWLWHPRTEGNEAGEWGLAGPGGTSTDRTRATQMVTAALAEHEDFFRAAKPVPARAAILYNRDAMLLYAVDGWRRPNDEITESLMGCYKALHRAHVPVDFLDTSELDAGTAGRYQVLYLPYCFALSAKSAEAVRRFVREGGTVWADGLVNWKDEGGKTLQMPPGALEDVFGLCVDDIEPVWEPFALTTEGDRAGELWRCNISLKGARQLWRAPDGRPAAVEHSFGKGKALYYSSALTYGYLHREDAHAGDWIASPALAALQTLPVRLIGGSPHIGFRVLEAGGRHAVVLTNWGDTTQATVQFPEAIHAVSDIITHIKTRSQNGSVTVQVKAGASTVLMTEVGV